MVNDSYKNLNTTNTERNIHVWKTNLEKGVPYKKKQSGKKGVLYEKPIWKKVFYMKNKSGKKCSIWKTSLGKKVFYIKNQS